MSYFPLKYQPRKEQRQILNFFSECVNNENKFILIDAPVGIGKSFSVIMMANWYRKNINPHAKFDIITNSKILQSQYTDDFEFINSLWGKANYKCEALGSTCEEGKELKGLLGSKCENCPYDYALEQYRKGAIGLTNFHMHCIFSVYKESIIKEKASKVLFIDEAHEFDEVFCEFISIKLNESAIKRFDLNSELTISLISELKRIKDESDFNKFVIRILPLINSRVDDIRLSLNRVSSTEKKEGLKKMSHIQNYVSKMENFVREYDLNSSNWMLNVEEFLDKVKKEKINTWCIEPVWSSIYLNDCIWNNYDHVVFMSGTILDKDLFCFLNGLNSSDTFHLKLDSPFPTENRPIYYKKQGKMSYNEKHKTWENYIPYIKKILDHHKDHKGIIHTNSYELAMWIQRDIKDDRLLFHDSKNKNDILNIHNNSKLPTVLISPSMENGINLKDDLSRFQIILKIPYPNLGSKRIKRRQELKPDWFNWKTSVDLVQSYGRSIRSEEDWAKTYLLDSNFDLLARNYKDKFPKYFIEAFK